MAFEVARMGLCQNCARSIGHHLPPSDKAFGLRAGKGPEIFSIAPDCVQ